MNRFGAKALRAVLFSIIGLVGCTVSPSRYNVRDSAGVNCYNLGDYSVAQSMQDMTVVVGYVYQGRASEQTLTYLTSSVRSATIGYCIRATGSVKPEDAVAYSLSRASSVAAKSVDIRSYLVDPRSAAALMTSVYVTVYKNTLADMSVGFK